jgi:hypothetical protein
MNRALAEAVIDVVGRRSLENAEKLQTFRGRDWRRAHHWLITSGLALHLLVALRTLGAESTLDDEYRRRLSFLYDASGLRTIELRRELLDLNRRFSALGVPFANWKGFALEPDFCPDIRLRPQMDLDFVIAHDDADAFHRVLLEAGYKVSGVAHNELRYENVPGCQYSLEEVYCPKPHRKVELHLGTDTGTVPDTAIDLEGALQRRWARNMEENPFPVLAPADAFLAHGAHAGRHALSGWVRIGWLLELDTFLQTHAHDAAIWDQSQSRINPNSAASIGLALTLMNSLFGRVVPESLRWATQALPTAIVKWLELEGQSFLLSDFPGTKLHLLLQRELLSTDEWLGLERKSLYPIKRPPRVAYADAKATVPQRARAAKEQFRFVCGRIKFHLVENARYFVMKRRWHRTVSSVER